MSTPPTIVVGLHGQTEPEYAHALAEAGAGEFFLGYVPEPWWKRWGFEVSPNRRYRQNQQFIERTRLEAVLKQATRDGIPVSLTFNEHFITQDMWDAALPFLKDAVKLGVSAIIVADPGVLLPLRSEFPGLGLHVSGDAGVTNPRAVEWLHGLGATRVIFPRELAYGDMLPILDDAPEGLEFEAFVMGEPCVYDGARCFTEHGYGFSCDFCNNHIRKTLFRRGESSGVPLDPPDAHWVDDPRHWAVRSLGKCGLCAIGPLMTQGVSHIKIPGRASQAMATTTLVARMLRHLNEGAPFARGLLEAPDVCSSKTFCYYPELADD